MRLWKGKGKGWKSLGFVILSFVRSMSYLLYLEFRWIEEEKKIADFNNQTKNYLKIKSLKFLITLGMEEQAKPLTKIKNSHRFTLKRALSGNFKF